MHKITLNEHSNPLSKALTSSTVIIIDKQLTVANLINNYNLNKNSYYVRLNNLYLTAYEVQTTYLKNNDVISVYTVACEPLSLTTAVLWTFEAGSFAVGTALTAFGKFVVSSLITLTLNLAVNALTRKNRAITEQDKSTSVLGIGLASNAARQYAPLPLLLGKIRVFPDLAQKQFNDYCIDNSGSGVNAADFYKTASLNTPSITFANNVPTGWTFINTFLSLEGGNGTGRDYGPIDVYGFGPPRTYQKPKYAGEGSSTRDYSFILLNVYQAATIDLPRTAGFWYLTTYEIAARELLYYSERKDMILNNTMSYFSGYASKIINISNTQYQSNIQGSYDQVEIGVVTINPANTTQPMPFNLVEYWGYPARIQRLTAVFNLGFGDLVLSDERIGKTRLSDYLSVKANEGTAQIKRAEFTTNDTLLIGFQHQDYVKSGISLSANNIKFKHYVNYNNGVTQVDDAYPTNIDIVSGGSLSRVKNQSNGQETSATNGFFYRTGGAASTGVYGVQIDFTGRIFEASKETGAINPRDVFLEIYYKYSSTTNEQSRVEPPNGWVLFDANYKITSGNTNGFRDSIYIDMTMQNNAFSNAVEVAVRKKSYDVTDPNVNEEISIEQVKFFQVQTHKYPAQNRFGLQIQATNQLNGQLDKLSLIGSCKTWVLVDNGGTDEFLPSVNNKEWAWQETSNPAWWYLYFALGSFLNEQVPNNHPLYSEGWMLGQNTNNKQQLFGLAEDVENIDLEKIAAWAAYCDEKNLKFNYFTTEDGSKNCHDFLAFIAMHGRAKTSRNIKDGKLSVTFHQVNDPVTSIFGMSNIKANSFSLTYTNKKTYDAVVVNYADEALDYALKQVRVVVPFVTNPINTLNIDLKGCTSKEQAQREANLAAAAEFYGTEIVTFDVDAARLLVDVGDVIKVTHDVLSYADSGRIKKFIVNNSMVTDIFLSKDLNINVGTTYYLTIRTPNNELQTYNTVYAGNAQLKLTSDYYANDAAYITSTENIQVNESSLYFDSIPEDFIFMGSPQSQNGSKFRIIKITPNNGLDAKITAIREYAEYYACENNISNAANPGALPNSDVAFIDNFGIVKNDRAIKLHWDNINCLGAKLNITATYNNNTTASGQLIVNSDYIDLNYDIGTFLTIEALPNSIQTAHMQKSSTFTYYV